MESGAGGSKSEAGVEAEVVGHLLVMGERLRAGRFTAAFGLDVEGQAQLAEDLYAEIGRMTAGLIRTRAQVAKPEPAEPVVTISQSMLEKALRNWLEWFEYDLHKQTERDEMTGEDTYPEEAQRFFADLQKIAGV
ncbi:hypothetical protein ACIG3E_32575 [Streptomyces sp. NPDC053474]|uniref:hypothetical protein n=1 Tax=Streptomyces sp. NPDC053474 TaxID=3365704 RepID=UPI0037D76D9F